MLESIIEAIKAAGISCAAYAWHEAPAAPYATVALSGAASGPVWGDDGFVSQTVEGYVDLFVNGIGETERKAVQTALAGLSGLSFELNSVQYEDDTRLVHFEWIIRFAEGI